MDSFQKCCHILQYFKILSPNTFAIWPFLSLDWFHSCYSIHVWSGPILCKNTHKINLKLSLFFTISDMTQKI